MSTSLLNASKANLTLRTSPSLARSYAAKPESQGGDPRREVIRRVLYPSQLRNRPTPVGTWRSDVGRAIQHAIPSKQAHQTIERAWLLHQRHVRKQRDTELRRKFECMKKAMDELEKIDTRLYLEANRQEDPRARSRTEVDLIKTLKTSEVRVLEARIRGLFPRELKIPTDTPSRTGWNYESRPFPRPL
ncbi:hypothetical protein BDQ12DRAFT_703389 [Crucibulum laeve]|uniref:Large ribosomal subunit protein mL40 n=1 Tax=Crucibulum laeve TaxID=68775 RepID=A0A5C3MDH7_9AGAR|nr:hypothetical protein BDQ12DRAFT_703389 [Crucibulum laeve]